MKRLIDFELGGPLARVAAFAARNARVVVAAAMLASLVALVLALRLEPSAATETLVGRSDDTYQATQDFHRQFGDDPIVVLAQGKPNTLHALGAMVLTQDLAKLLSLEGCLSGNAPKRAKPPAPVCAEFTKTKPVKVVYGPGTFINEAASQISGEFEAEGVRRRAQAGRAAKAAVKVAQAQGLPPTEQRRFARKARQLVYAQFASDAAKLALKYGLTSVPALNNPDFVLRLAFEPSLGEGTPKPRFSYVFPSSNAALIQARLRPGLGDAQKKRAIELVREAVSDPAFKLKFGDYVVSGVPVVAQGVETSVADELRVLLLAAVVLMALALMIAFRVRRRLLALALALGAAALTFGLMSLLGVALTIAAIAVLPVLIGLAVDYAVQFQSRFREEGAEPAAAAESAARKGGPVIATAAVATATGFGVLLLSPVPMVRVFGLMLVLGIALAFVLALTVGFAVLGGDLHAPGVVMRIWHALRRIGARVEALWRAGPVGARRPPARGISPKRSRGRSSRLLGSPDIERLGYST
ncbi:MAG: MMPL family transporter [Solirubrobacterales bacterium]